MGAPRRSIRDAVTVPCFVRVREFLWPDERLAHVARHQVRPEEVEEACFGAALVQRARSKGPNPVYYVLGQTEAGRYLLCIVVEFPDDRGYPVTARDMTEAERRRYLRWLKR